LESTLGEMKGLRGGKALLIEFSIENVQVVKRRSERMERDRDDVRSEGGKDVPVKRRKIEQQPPESNGSGALKKDARNAKAKNCRKDRKGGKVDSGEKPAKETSAVPEKRGLEKLGAHLGSLIGRKRRRKNGK
jgi:nucleolar protein 4